MHAAWVKFGIKARLQYCQFREFQTMLQYLSTSYVPCYVLTLDRSCRQLECHFLTESPAIATILAWVPTADGQNPG